MWCTTSSTASLFCGSLSFCPSGALKTRLTDGALAGLPFSGKSSTARRVASIAGVPLMEYSVVIGFIKLKVAPPAAATMKIQAMMTFHRLM